MTLALAPMNVAEAINSKALATRCSLIDYFLSGGKEGHVSANILGPIVSGLNNEPDQETTDSEIDKKNKLFSLNF